MHRGHTRLYLLLSGHLLIQLELLELLKLRELVILFWGHERIRQLLRKRVLEVRRTLLRVLHALEHVVDLLHAAGLARGLPLVKHVVVRVELVQLVLEGLVLLMLEHEPLHLLCLLLLVHLLELLMSEATQVHDDGFAGLWRILRVEAAPVIDVAAFFHLVCLVVRSWLWRQLCGEYRLILTLLVLGLVHALLGSELLAQELLVQARLALDGLPTKRVVDRIILPVGFWLLE